MSKIRVIVNEGDGLRLKWIEDSLESLQEIVGGYIEMPNVSSLDEKGISMIINEEGKFISGLRPNAVFVDDHDEILDLVMGNIIYAAYDEEGNTVGLNDEQISYLYIHLPKVLIGLKDSVWEVNRIDI